MLRCFIGAQAGNSHTRILRGAEATMASFPPSEPHFKSGQKARSETSKEDIWLKPFELVDVLLLALLGQPVGRQAGMQAGKQASTNLPHTPLFLLLPVKIAGIGTCISFGFSEKPLLRVPKVSTPLRARTSPPPPSGSPVLVDAGGFSSRARQPPSAGGAPYSSCAWAQEFRSNEHQGQSSDP